MHSTWCPCQKHPRKHSKIYLKIPPIVHLCPCSLATSESTQTVQTTMGLSSGARMPSAQRLWTFLEKAMSAKSAISPATISRIVHKLLPIMYARNAMRRAITLEIVPKAVAVCLLRDMFAISVSSPAISSRIALIDKKDSPEANNSNVSVWLGSLHE